LGQRPILVVRHRLDQDRRAPRTVALERDLFVSDSRKLPRAPLDRPLDVFGGHVDGLRVVDRLAESGIRVRRSAAQSRGHRDLPNELRDEATALRVGRVLFVFDSAPLAVAGTVIPRRRRELYGSGGWRRQTSSATSATTGGSTRPRSCSSRRATRAPTRKRTRRRSERSRSSRSRSPISLCSPPSAPLSLPPAAGRRP